MIAPGAVVMAMIYAAGPLSGLHINPAVTIAFTARRVFQAVWAIPYIAVQLAGAICAALVLQAMYTTWRQAGITRSPSRVGSGGRW